MSPLTGGKLCYMNGPDSFRRHKPLVKMHLQWEIPDLWKTQEDSLKEKDELPPSILGLPQCQTVRISVIICKTKQDLEG